MAKKVVIVHCSDIIRMGLAAIIKKFFNVEIIQCRGMEEYQSFSVKPGSLIVIADADLPGHQLQGILSTQTLIALAPSGSIPGATKNLSYHLPLSASISEIQVLLETLVKLGGTEDTGGREGEELSSREKDVLTLVALGHTNKEIADALFISIHTVISHRKNITEKLGIKSISGLTVYAILNNIIDTSTIDVERLI